MTKRDEIRAFFSGQIEENLDALYGVALRQTRSGADAEDLVAEAVIKAWTAINTLEDRSRFRPWIFRILRNCSISQYRKQSVRPVETRYEDGDDDELATLLNEQSDDFLIWWANPEREFFNDVLGETIMSEIERLPEAFRMTIILINVEGLTYDEAAEVLDIPPGTVRSRMKRGRTLLQKSLWEQAKEAGLTDDRPDGIRQ
jgi:RNA polymerase sigma-70 factor (ECF subfamily)